MKVKEHPILFSTEMIRAILDGRKTQTRRVIKPQPPSNCDTPVFDPQGRGWFYDGLDGDGDCLDSWPENDTGLLCPYQVGMKLWVRETWATIKEYDDLSPSSIPLYDYPPKLWYAEWTGSARYHEHRGRLRPSIHMPRWASRITLEVVDVRVERVQDISERDAVAEGVQRNCDGDYESCPMCYGAFTCMADNEYIDYLSGDEAPPVYSAKESFRTLWDSINAKRSYGWSENPWVWVVTFKRIKTDY